MRQLTHKFNGWRFSATDTNFGAGVFRLCLAVNVEDGQIWVFQIYLEPIPDNESMPKWMKEAVGNEPVNMRSRGYMKCSVPGRDAAWLVPSPELIAQLATDDGELAVNFGLFVHDDGNHDAGLTLDPDLADELRRLLDDLE